MLSNLLLLIFFGTFLVAHCLRCNHNTIIYEDVRVGGIHSIVEQEMDQGSVLCEAGLDRCAKFAKTNVTEFDTPTAGIKVTEGSIAGTSCTSQATCANMKASTQSDCSNVPNGSSCCCSTDNCNGNASEALSILGIFAIISATLSFV